MKLSEKKEYTLKLDTVELSALKLILKAAMENTDLLSEVLIFAKKLNNSIDEIWGVMNGSVEKK